MDVLPVPASSDEPVEKNSEAALLQLVTDNPKLVVLISRVGVAWLEVWEIPDSDPLRDAGDDVGEPCPDWIHVVGCSQQEKEILARGRTDDRFETKS